MGGARASAAAASSTQRPPGDGDSDRGGDRQPVNLEPRRQRVLGLLLVVGCRAATEWPGEVPPEPQPRPDFGTETTDVVSADEASWLQVATQRDDPMRHDARLDALAEHIAAYPLLGRRPTGSDVDRWALALGTPYLPTVAVLPTPTAADNGVDAWFDALPGDGPIAFGVASAPGVVVLAAARAWFSLAEPVPREGGTIAVRPLEGLDVELIVVSAAQVERVQPSRLHGGVAQFAAQSRVVVEISGRVAAPDEGPLVHTTADETLGRIRFDDAPTWEAAPTLRESLAVVRAAMSRPPLTWVDDAHVRCEDPGPVRVGDRIVQQTQSCMTVAAGGSVRRRSETLLGRPSVVARLADPQWEFAELDASEPELVRLRFTRVFRPREASEIRAEIAEGIAKRWPDSKPTAELDTPLVALLQRWSKTADVVATNPAHAADVVALAKAWAPTPRYFQALLATQDPATVFERIPADVDPQQHAVAVVAGVGPRGEPLYLVAIVLAIL